MRLRADRIKVARERKGVEKKAVVSVPAIPPAAEPRTAGESHGA
jgi:hypothetical protein